MSKIKHKRLDFTTVRIGPGRAVIAGGHLITYTDSEGEIPFTTYVFIKKIGCLSTGIRRFLKRSFCPSLCNVATKLPASARIEKGVGTERIGKSRFKGLL
ncbi:hypothetical protein [Parapedobacter tibetensis]|uniref:hypothetical protein n=1 Tax=Parapedobacter tibetensis TaxID=2972951 RepID=UPI00214D2BBF|nr:hypothetical protein [Parapedobacter tibetensis]